MTKKLYLEAIEALRQRVEAMGEREELRVLDMLAEEVVKALARFHVAQRGESAEPPADDLRPETPETWQTFATIRPESERATWWREVFGGDRCPVKSILAQRGNLPGKPDALFYEMDIRALTPEMRERLVQSIAKRFEQDPAFAEANLDREGCPVLADDVVVTTTKVGLFLPDVEVIPADFEGDIKIAQMVKGDARLSAGLNLEDEEDPDDVGDSWLSEEEWNETVDDDEDEEDDDLFTGGDWDPEEDSDLWEDDPDFAREYIGDDDGEDDELGL